MTFPLTLVLPLAPAWHSHSHQGHDDERQLVRTLRRVQPHSQGAELTRLARFASLHAYTCVLAPEIHRYVDMGKNCEDIAVNMMISGLTGLPPVCVEEHEVLDFGTSRGISISSAFTHRRDQCTADLIKLFGRDTLIETREFVRPFDANKFRKVKWEELDNVLVSFPPRDSTFSSTPGGSPY